MPDERDEREPEVEVEGHRRNFTADEPEERRPPARDESDGTADVEGHRRRHGVTEDLRDVEGHRFR